MTHPPLYQMEPVFDEAEVTAVADCIRSSWVIEAQRTTQFEQKIADFVGTTYAVCVPSCTTAMALCLMALGIGPGDEVLVPALTFVATANAVSLAGATPVILDIRADSHGLDYTLIRPAITPRTKAIMPVWMNGHDPHMRQICQVADEFGLPVIEDAACALGSRSGGQHAGTFGLAGCISLNTTKIITTGTGGVIVTDDANFFDAVKRLKNHGRRDRQDFHPVVGYNFGFSDLLAALGLAQMDKLPGRVTWKQQLCQQYNTHLAQIDGLTLHPPQPGICPWYPDIFIDNRDALKAHLATHNIQTRAYYPPINTQPSYHDGRPTPIATAIAQRGLWLPSAAYVDSATVDRVCETITRWKQQG